MLVQEWFFRQVILFDEKEFATVIGTKIQYHSLNYFRIMIHILYVIF